MSVSPAKAHHVNAGTLTTAGNTGVGVNAVKNLSDLSNPRVVAALINLPNNPTGTSPTITFTLDVSLDGNVWYNAKTSSAQSAAGTVRLVGTDIIEPFVRVAWTLTGTTPSFAGVTIDILHN